MSWKCRHTLTLLGFLAFVNLYMLRVNLSVALVAMVNSTHSATTRSSDCPSDNSTTPDDEPGHVGPFNWSKFDQGIILGAFFWGYIVTQLPGGILSARNPKWAFGLSVLLTALLTLLTPLAASAGQVWVIVLRLMEGLTEGVSFPAMNYLLGKWIPPLERTMLGAFIYSGTQMGTILGLSLSGMLCHYPEVTGGWPSVFYIFGGLGVVWFIGWHLLIYNSPTQHPRIDEEERRYIIISLGLADKDGRELKTSHAQATPWRAIATSPAVWAIIAAHFANNWSWYSMITTLPTYMNDVLGFSLEMNGVLSSLPYCCAWLSTVTTSQVVDRLRRFYGVSTTLLRKVVNALALFGVAVGLIGVGWASCSAPVAVAILCVSMFLLGMGQCGFAVNHLDIAPQFAGNLFAISNTFASIPGVTGPYIVGLLTQQNSNRHSWMTFFYISAAISVLGGLCYLILGSGRQQKWALPHYFTLQEDKSEDEQTNSDDEMSSRWNSARSATTSDDARSRLLPRTS